jgi:four helix bundle protein
MFLLLSHQQLDIYPTSKKFVHECYKFTNTLPSEEKFGLISLIRRAALSVHLNIAEGASRRSKQKEKDFMKLQEVL